MRVIGALAALMVGCGPDYQFGQDTIDPKVEDIQSVNGSPSKVFALIGAMVTKKAGQLGYVTEHMTHARYTIDDEFIARYKADKGLQGELLGLAGCADWREHCAAYFPSWLESDDNMRLGTGIHEALHLLGFEHEECTPGECTGIMGAFYDHRFEGYELESLTMDYLRKLPYKEPITI